VPKSSVRISEVRVYGARVMGAYGARVRRISGGFCAADGRTEPIRRGCVGPMNVERHRSGLSTLVRGRSTQLPICSMAYSRYGADASAYHGPIEARSTYVRRHHHRARRARRGAAPLVPATNSPRWKRPV